MCTSRIESNVCVCYVYPIDLEDSRRAERDRERCKRQRKTVRENREARDAPPATFPQRKNHNQKHIVPTHTVSLLLVAVPIPWNTSLFYLLPHARPTADVSESLSDSSANACPPLLDTPRHMATQAHPIHSTLPLTLTHPHRQGPRQDKAGPSFFVPLPTPAVASSSHSFLPFLCTGGLVDA